MPLNLIKSSTYSGEAPLISMIAINGELARAVSYGEEYTALRLSSADSLHNAVRTVSSFLRNCGGDISVDIIVPDGDIPFNDPELDKKIAYSERPLAMAPMSLAQSMQSGTAAKTLAADAASENSAPLSPAPEKKKIFGLFGRKTHEAAPAAAMRTSKPEEHYEDAEAASALPAELSRAVREIDESFTEMLLRKIDERGISDAQCYKKANVDRKLFSKIRSDMHYHPKKTTAIAFAIALQLDLSETSELLRKAGFALSRSSKFDIIVEYYIKKRCYDVFEINEALFAYDQSLIGA